MSETTELPATPPTADPLAPAPKTSPYETIAKYTVAIALGASVLALTLTGKVPVDIYLATVVTPGLAFLGYHAAANS